MSSNQVLITHGELWYVYLWYMFGYYYSFVILTCWLHQLILLLALAYDFSCYIIILLSLTCIFSFLYISFILAWLILFIIYYLVYLNILFILVIYLSCFLLSLCVDMNDIPVICLTTCYMTTLFLHDACIVCLCDAHIYPITSNSLVSVDLVSLDLIFDMRLVTLFALWLS